MYKSKRYPQDWQKDATKITTDTVQFWSAGNLANAQMSNKEARLLVETGNAFVINDQAIGLLVDGGMQA